VSIIEEQARLRAAMALVDRLFDEPEERQESLLGSVPADVRVEARKLLAADAAAGGDPHPRVVETAVSPRLVDRRFRLRPGDVFADRFVVEGFADAGGMGVVYRARDGLTGVPVAVKVLATTRSDQAERFVSEMRLLAELEHPGIVRYVAHGLASTGDLYLVMEWLEGKTLSQRLCGRPLRVRESVDIVHRAAQALAAAHQKGVVHRDLKPSNLFLVDGDARRLKLLDFGIARDRASGGITETGALMGTLGYMAPEQARGGEEVDFRADLFSLGCVFFECLTGEPAFAGEHAMAVLAKILVEQPPPPSSLRDGIPAAIDDLVARLLAKPPDQRPRDATAVAEELEDLVVPSEPGGMAASARRQRALTTGEQRLVSVVFGPAPASKETDGATREPHDAASRTWLTARMATLGAQPQWTADGSMLVAVAARGAATDMASRAARCARVAAETLDDRDFVVVTAHAVMQSRQPVGEALDRAVEIARLRRVAGAPDSHHVYLDEVTAALVGARFELREDALGLSLGRERDASEVGRTLLGKPSLFLGREREMAMLSAVFEECVGEPSAHAVLVTGPPGIGKSRLRAEFLHALRGKHPEANVWLVRADPTSKGSPFGLLAEVVKQGLGLRPGQPMESTRAALGAHVRRIVTEEQRPRVAEFLAELVGAPFSSEASVALRAAREDAVLMGDQIRRACEDFVQAQATERPVVIVLEDLHWGDLPTVRCVDGLLRNVDEAPILALALARPEVHELFPNLWKDRGVTELRLGGLSRKASERLVRETLGGEVTGEEMARIVERAEGNAFYLEELIRARAEGRLSSLPKTVLAMVAGRLASLDGEARRAIRAASVFGESFSRDGVQTLLGGRDRTADVSAWLEELASKELVTSHSTDGGRAHEVFAFRHAIVREAAYAMLTEADRALGHRLAGEWLEGTGEQDDLVLAEHFERGGVRDKAAHFFHRAAAHALEGNDPMAAVAHADRAVACGATAAQLGSLRMLQAMAHRWGGTIEQVDRYASEAIGAYRAGEPGWFDAVGLSVWAGSRLGHAERVKPLLEELKSQSPADGAVGASVVALCRVACQMVSEGDFAEAAKLHELAESRAGRGDASPIEEAYLSRARGFVATIVRGDSSRGAVYAADAAAAFLRAGDARSACQEQINVGNAYTLLGAYAEAKEVLLAAHATATRLGAPAMKAIAEHNLGVALAGLGEIAEACAFEKTAIEGLDALGDRAVACVSAAYLARIRLDAGDHDGAADALRLAFAYGRQHPAASAVASAVQARLHLVRGEVAEALAAARRAKATLDEQGTLEDAEQLTRLVYAEALAAAGAHEEARAALESACEALRKAASRIDDEARRAAFLRIPESARTIALAERRGR
jgi:tetratricopeptide (TPR) repeat protein